MRKDGSLFQASVVITPIRYANGRLMGYSKVVRDITERKRAESNQIRLNRELKAISDCNQAIVRSTNEQGLFTDICRIMCEEVGYSMAWVGAVEHDEAKSVRPLAWYGDDNGYLAKVSITWADTERGQGPTGIAARTGKTDFCQDFITEPKVAPWRQEALARGFHSSIAMPLLNNQGNVFAVLTLYAKEPNGFTPGEVRLLEELAGDLAFGIGALRANRERIKAEEELSSKRETTWITCSTTPMPPSSSGTPNSRLPALIMPSNALPGALPMK